MASILWRNVMVATSPMLLVVRHQDLSKSEYMVPLRNLGCWRCNHLRVTQLSATLSTFSYISLLILHYLLLWAQLLLLIGLLFLFLFFSSYWAHWLLFVAIHIYSCCKSNFTSDVCTCTSAVLRFTELSQVYMGSMYNDLCVVAGFNGYQLIFDIWIYLTIHSWGLGKDITRGRNHASMITPLGHSKTCWD